MATNLHFVTFDVSSMQQEVTSTWRVNKKYLEKHCCIINIPKNSKVFFQILEKAVKVIAKPSREMSDYASTLHIYRWYCVRIMCTASLRETIVNREIKLDVTSNGKRQKWNFCGLSLALWTVEWKYLYLWRIVGDIFLFLCDLIKD